MKRTSWVFVFGVVIASTSSACEDWADDLTGGGSGEEPNGGHGSGALECTQAQVGRTYILFDGSKLEATRPNEAVGLNRARMKPFPAMQNEYQRVLGVVPASIKEAGGSFEAPPARWFREAEYSGVSLLTIGTISFDACVEYTKAPPAFGAVPTPETAAAECSTLMRKAWSRAPSPDEIAGCANLVMKLSDEKDVRRRWAYGCASVLSATQFLSF